MTDIAKKLPAGKNPDTRRLWEQIFDEDTEDFLDYYDEWKMEENTCYGIYREQRLISMLQLNPYEMVWSGRTVPTAYIIAVATDLEFRHQGLMTKLLKKSLGDLREKGVPFVFLMPADEAIYLPSGFRYFYCANTEVFRAEDSSDSQSLRTEIPAEALILQAVDTAEAQMFQAETRDAHMPSGWTMHTASENQLPEIMKWAERLLAEQFDIYTKRDEHYWKTLLAEVACENGKVLVLRKEGELRAVIPVWGWEETEIREILCRPADEAPVTRIMKLCAAAADPHAELREDTAATAADSGAELRADTAAMAADPHAGHKIAADGIPWETGQKKPVIMGRIVDAQSFLSLYNGKEENILLKLSDEFLPENEGFYDWRISENGSSARRVTGEEAENLKKTHRLLEAAAPEIFRKTTSGKRVFINEIV